MVALQSRRCRNGFGDSPGVEEGQAAEVMTAKSFSRVLIGQYGHYHHVPRVSPWYNRDTFTFSLRLSGTTDNTLFTADTVKLLEHWHYVE